MGVEVLTVEQARSATLAGLGFSDELALDCPEVLAQSLRRTASFACPITSDRLVRVVEEFLSPLLAGGEDLRSRLTEVLDALVAVGDLLERPDVDSGSTRRLLYLGYPKFVARDAGDFVLLGTRPDGASLVDDDVLAHIMYQGHLRRIAGGGVTAAQLIERGLRQVSTDEWLRSPQDVAAEDFVRTHDVLLEAEPPSGEVPGLSLIDPTKSPRFYRGRWRPPDRRDTGRFVARREQAHGSPLWCYVEVANGSPTRFIDLPSPGARHLRGCDEAWRLQAALDAVGDQPQAIRVTGTGAGTVVVGITIPPPAWLQRRWDLFGTQTKQKGSVIAYELSATDARQEVAFAQSALWLECLVNSGVP